MTLAIVKNVKKEHIVQVRVLQQDLAVVLEEGVGSLSDHQCPQTLVPGDSVGLHSCPSTNEPCSEIKLPRAQNIG